MKRVLASSRGKQYDKEGLVAAVRNVMQVAHEQSRFKDCKLNMHSIRVTKERRPVRFNAKIEFTLEGPVKCKYTYHGFTGSVFINNIPTDTEITHNYYSDNPTVIKEVIDAMENNYTLEGDYSHRASIFDNLVRSYQAEVAKISDKYDVELKAHVYPDEPEAGEWDYICFYCDLVSVDHADFHFTLGENHYGVLTDRKTNADIELYVGQSSQDHHYLQESSEAIISDVAAKLDRYIAKKLATFRDTVKKLQALPNNEHVVDTFLQQFTQKYASQYPGLSMKYRSYLGYASLSVSCDPDIQLTKDVEYPCSSSDYPKWTKSILGMLKRRLGTDTKQYSTDSELITL